MPNGSTRTPLGLVVPPEIKSEKEMTCHRFFAPVVVPEPDPLNPRNLNIRPRMGNFPCIKEKCMLWNADKTECWDKTQAKALEVISQYAFNLMNDVSTGVDSGG